MSTTTYVFMEKLERYQHFSDEKSALSVAMIPCLLFVVVLQRSSSTRKRAPLGVYLVCSLWLYYRGAPLQDKEYK